jgi:hypothetical protein
MSEYHFHSRLKSHVGGLVRLDAVEGDALGSIRGTIGILLKYHPDVSGGARVELLIDGRIRSTFLFEEEIELIESEGSDGTDENTSQFSSPPFQPLRTEL